MKTLVYTILLLSLFLAGCHKREYPPSHVQNNPQAIFFDGSADGKPVSFRIGQDGYYCYSSYSQTRDSVYLFSGELRKYDCSDCPLSLKVELSDYRQRTMGSLVPADSVFRTGDRKFIPGVVYPHTLNLKALSGKNIASVQWKSSAGWSSSDQATSLELTQPGITTLSLSVRTVEGSENTVMNSIYVAKSGEVFACGIQAIAGTGNSGTFSASLVGGKAPFVFNWSFSDGALSQQNNTSHVFKYAGSYPVRLKVTDADGRVCESNIIFVTASDKSSASISMDLTEGGRRNALLNGVRITFTDENNNKFYSDSTAQDSPNYFEISGSRTFENNEKGEAGRLLSIRMNVTLSSGNKKIYLKTDNAQMAVSYR